MGGCRTVGPIAYEKPGKWHRGLLRWQHAWCTPFSALGLLWRCSDCGQVPNIQSVKIAFHIFLTSGKTKKNFLSFFVIGLKLEV